jgi:hypothetical protein
VPCLYLIICKNLPKTLYNMEEKYTIKTGDVYRTFREGKPTVLTVG